MMSEEISNARPNGALVLKLLFISAILAVMVFVLSNSFFYAEPGYIYHVRTFTGQEEVVTEVGYKFYPFGRYNS